MTLTILSSKFALRVAQKLFYFDHPESSWQSYPSASQAKRQARYEIRAAELINMTVDEYERVRTLIQRDWRQT